MPVWIEYLPGIAKFTTVQLNSWHSILSYQDDIKDARDFHFWPRPEEEAQLEIYKKLTIRMWLIFITRPMRRLLLLRYRTIRSHSTMALNAASHNPAGVKTGPISGQPPPLSSETAAAVSDASRQDKLGHNEGGRDGGDKQAGAKIKSEKELEKERKKLEKQKKFDEKKAKSAASSAAPETSKSKDKKSKQESAKEATLPAYVEETTPGDKKSLFCI